MVLDCAWWLSDALAMSEIRAAREVLAMLEAWMALVSEVRAQAEAIVDQSAAGRAAGRAEVMTRAMAAGGCSERPVWYPGR